MRRILLYISALSILMVLLLGCGGPQSGGNTSQTEEPSMGNAPSAAMEEYKYYMEQAGIAQAEQQLDDALDYYLSAATTLEETGQPSVKLADAHYEAAQISYQLYKKELAIEEYESAAAIYLRFSGNAQTKAAVVYTNMGVVWKEMNNKSKARTCWQQALDIYQKVETGNQNKIHIEKIQQNIRDLDEGF